MLAQDPLQGGKRPCGGAILLALRGAPRCAEDLLPLSRGVKHCGAASMTGLHSEQTLAIEATHQLRHRIARKSPGPARCRGESLPSGHSQQGFGTGHMTGGGRLATTNRFKLLALWCGECP